MLLLGHVVVVVSGLGCSCIGGGVVVVVVVGVVVFVVVVVCNLICKIIAGQYNL